MKAVGNRQRTRLKPFSCVRSTCAGTNKKVTLTTSTGIALQPICERDTWARAPPKLCTNAPCQLLRPLPSPAFPEHALKLAGLA